MKKITIIIILVFLFAIACSHENNKGNQGDEMKFFKQDDGMDVKIPKNPKRIVVLHPAYIGALVKFGHKPVGVIDYVKQNKTLDDATKGSKIIGTNDIESIVNLKPDLIITTKEDKNYKKLKKIAPTIQMDARKSDYKATTKKLAQTVNEEEKANNWIKGWDKQLKKDKALLGSEIGSKSITVLQSTPKGISVFGKNYGRGSEVVYDGYGMEQPDKLKEETQNAYMVNITQENLLEYTGDYILLATTGGKPDFTKTDNWKNLNAVKNKRILEVDLSDTQYNDPISLEKQRKIILTQLKDVKKENDAL